MLAFRERERERELHVMLALNDDVCATVVSQSPDLCGKSKNEINFRQQRWYLTVCGLTQPVYRNEEKKRNS